MTLNLRHNGGKNMKKKYVIAATSLALLGLVVSGCSSNNNSSSSEKASSSKVEKKNSTKKSSEQTGKAKVHTTTNEDTHNGEKTNKDDNDNNSSKNVEFDNNNLAVASSKTFQTNYKDTSWPGGAVKIDKIVVDKLAKPYSYESANDGTFDVNGVVKVYMTFTAAQDVSFYPTQGTANFSNGEQADTTGEESWDGDINSGATKSGTLTFPVKNLDNPDAIKNIRLQFDGNSKNTDDDSLDKTFDLTIDLN